MVHSRKGAYSSLAQPCKMAYHAARACLPYAYARARARANVFKHIIRILNYAFSVFWLEKQGYGGALRSARSGVQAVI
jgi:hypothetical protein